ncbi:MAG: TRAP transporter small permease [Roseovarius sp.]|jgi:TRAP-type C4-dicarboxylate transport system permease small subunit|nr:TRAP transporter small permease [Roseovarius sp.]
MTEGEVESLPTARGPVTRVVRVCALTLAIAGGLGTVVIMAIIAADVIGRGLFSAPFPATAEIVAASIVAIVFLQLPYATLSGRAVRSDMLMKRLRSRSQRAGDWLDLVHHLIGTVMLAVLLRYIWPEITGAVRGNETVGLYGILELPRWPFVVAVLIGCALTLAAYAVLTGEFMRRLRGKGTDGQRT